MTDVIASLPKTDLHLHLIGSASVDTVLELAKRHPDRGVPTDREALADFYAFRDFPHFIEVYTAVDALVTTADDIAALVIGAARDAAASNVRWAEITVTANTHFMAGIAPADLHAALTQGREAARADHGVELGWIFDIPGERGLPAADATLDFLRTHAPEGTVALGLAGMEDGVPRARFADHFAQARALGLKSVVHAGETTGPDTVWSALRDLEADRIGHGTSATRDPELVTHLVEHAVPVEVCVSSNLRTNSVSDLASHPVAALLAAGVTVCVATDDPGMFDTDLDREYRLIADLAGLDVAGVCDLARAGVAASYAPDSLKKDLTDRIADIQVRAQAPLLLDPTN
ncbi:adenosine deaminase [Actinokineospora xionganensis]|uniref:Adenosine deaminase n=1 Tax=Actinokineospora xionganensis TaxID=2684470 RepID=A0ABR7L9Y9_9PSEU|nr:adenosine deaminase [Actinokineospora xionganensis]MBC6449516.1 adenosine deaminase [Actinokineospora xionganensis]